MRVLMISKACVTASYRSKIAYMHQMADMEMGLVVPDHWANLPFEPDSADEAYPIYKLPIPFNGKNHFHWYPKLTRIIRDFKPDLVHIDEEHYSFVTWQGVRAARKLGVPSLFFTWQNIYKRYPLPFSAIEQDVFRGTRGAIAGNQDAEQVLRKKGYTKPVTVVPQFGTDLALFGPRDRQALRRQYNFGQSFVVGYVGRLIEDKGIGDLLASIRPVLQKNSDVGLLIVGTGPYDAQIRDWADGNGLAKQVTRLPWVSSDAMGDVMNLMDVLVLPSRTTARWKEQFGRVLTEAMASHDVVIGSDSGEIPNVIGDAGLVFPEGDVPQLTEAIRRVLQDDALRATLAQRGAERVRDHFTQEAIAAKTCAFYRDLLGGMA
ncbi:glycosyltransferase family 4 protein [Sulfobacillus harzensis]|uniref:Glycosyltransferase family 4 protein n=1 Tax=Sulfobacillus harzensis TaxID=2729629 RepID=A0A7Y0Q1I3_9FIRM|nr:glycosyltransferase family 4 protein [Sulfobacillus harzensis]NMP20866.1 glycosyltransferase family 4 protein [Sulfobacillus harzensis]